MVLSYQTLRLFFAGAALAALAACGGGGGGGGSAGSAATGPIVFSGVAATGAPFGNALVTVYDQTGGVVGTTTTADLTGGYSVQLAAGAKPPFVVEATRGDVTLVSTFSEATSSTLNVTPITTLIASRLTADGNPVNLKLQVKTDPNSAGKSKLAEKVAEVLAIIKPLLDALGDSTNPLTGSFVADGTQYDRVLDSLKITIQPTDTGANIEIGIKQTSTGSGQPNVVQFTNTTASGSIPPVATVSSANLVAPGTSAQITDLINRLTACYGVPFANRVSGVAGTATFVNGTASAVIAPECKTVFWNDDPATFLSNGNVVGNGPSTNGNWAFSGLFKSGATGVVWSNGNYEFNRSNGDVVFTYTTTDTAGNVGYGGLVARALTQGSKTVLKLIGNQYAYPGDVYAYHQNRQFITLGQSAFNYYSSGYSIDLPNWQTTANTPVFNRVEAVTPKGGTVTFTPRTGVSYLSMVNATATTSYLRLRSVYADSANTADPVAKDTAFNGAVAVPYYTDAELASLPAQAVWTLRYFLAGNTTSVPDATQTYKTRARALTIPELKTKGLARLTDSVLADIQANSDPTTGVLSLPGTSPAQPQWVVPAGAVVPTSAKIFGRNFVTGNPAFDDAAGFGSTARQASIYCTPLGSGDTHCQGGTNGGFASTAKANGLHLFGYDSGSRAYASFYAMYKLN